MYHLERQKKKLNIQRETKDHRAKRKQGSNFTLNFPESGYYPS